MILLAIPFRNEIRSILIKTKSYLEADGGGSGFGISGVVRQIENHYGDEIDSLAMEFDLPSEYFKALIAIESGGVIPPPSRYERHVHNRLMNVRDGKRNQYEVINSKKISDANDDALANLATSWGPFQIMGYKCVQLNILVGDIRGSEAIYWGMKWIDEEYGHLLKKRRFKDAFHFHNTGRLYPKTGPPRTYHPEYVEKGMRYLNLFQ